MINKLQEKENNDAYNGMLKEFSLQIFHEPIVMTANGFFNINLHLLGSVS